MSLISLGTVAIDNIRAGKHVKENLLGGSAGHFAMSARLFTKVHLVSIVGEDFPQKHIRFLERRGIDISSVLREKGKSFAWHGEYRDDDYNNAITISTELGVLLNYSPHVVLEHRDLPHVFLANFDPDIQMEFLNLMNRPRLIGMDTMNLWIEHKLPSVRKLMKRADLFVINDGEAGMLTGESNLIKAAKKIRRMGPELVVIKKGAHGVLFYSDDVRFSFSAYPVENVVDPTGAGDTFAGALMGSLAISKKRNVQALKKAVLYATTVASFNVEGFGMTKTADLDMDKVEARMKDYVQFISHQ